MKKQTIKIGGLDFICSEVMQKIFTGDMKFTKADCSELTMIEKFFLMRSAFSSRNFKHCISSINQAKKFIIESYSEEFRQNEALHFEKNIFIRIYENSLQSEIAKIQEIDCNHKISKNFIQICETVSEIKKQVIAFNLWLENNPTKNFSNINSSQDLLKYQDSFSQERYLTLSESNVQELKKLFSPISKLLHECYKLIAELLLKTNSEEFKDLRKILNDNNCYWSDNVLSQFQYALDGAFHKEVLLIFLFSGYDKTGADEYLNCVVSKTEQFFIDLYEAIPKFEDKKILIEFDIPNISSRTSDQYVNPELFKFNNDRKYFFRLKKILALFDFYVQIKGIEISQEIKNAIRDYKEILTESKMILPEQNAFFVDLSSNLLDILNLTNKELAEILNKDESTIFRQKENGELLKKNLWFWQAATGFTDTFLRGESTIPYYGKEGKSDLKYFNHFILRTSFGELFWSHIKQLETYDENLKRNKKLTPKKHIFSEEYLKQIDLFPCSMMNELRRHRKKLEKLYSIVAYDKMQLNPEMELIDTELLNEDELQQKKAKYEQSLNLAEQYRKTLTETCNECLQLFKDIYYKYN